jgi:arylsulfatase A-like enzyme
VQAVLLLVNMTMAKVMAVSHAYPDAPAPRFAAILALALGEDALLTALLAGAALALRPMVAHRGAAAVWAITIAYVALAAFHYLNAGFYMYFGAPLNRGLLPLAPALLPYAAHVVTQESLPLVQLLAVGTLLPLLVAPIAARELRERLVAGGRWRPAAVAIAAALALFAGAMRVPRPQGVREVSLRRLSLLSGLTSGGTVRAAEPPDASQRAVLAGLVGGTREEGAAAFASMPRRPRNVVLWVWESVGARFLRSSHPLGIAATPHLDRLAAGGAVRFSNAQTECPASALSDWAMMTGRTPPVDPTVFVSGAELPPHGPLLPAVLAQAGYATAFVSSSYLDSWGELRFLREGRFDLLEDGHTLSNRHRFQYDRWSIDGRAVLERLYTWLDGVPRDQPFFAVVWNVESHHPYTWVGMPESLRAAGDLERYAGVIERTDAQLGEVHDRIAAQDRAHDTLFVVIGDHGQGLGRGERPYDRIHSLLTTEDDLHVPLVFVGADLPRPPAVVPFPVTHKDLYPTVLDLLGLPRPAGTDGSSLAAPYAPEVIVHRTLTWWPAAVRAGRFKLVQDRAGDPPELYDVSRDTWEVHDVSSRERTVTEAMLAWLTWVSAPANRGRAAGR